MCIRDRSYTSFEYSDLRVTADGVEFVLTNTGKMDGAEVAQMYVCAPKGKIFRPDKELKGFAKVFLKAGEDVYKRQGFLRESCLK